MEAKHTQEPWEAERDGDRMTGRILGADHDWLADVYSGNDQAIARRIAACCDACQSIPTEALEAGVVGELVEAVRKASLWVDQYRALPAHKAAAEAMLRVLDAALAKAKGGK
jgi:hypothetical protein